METPTTKELCNSPFRDTTLSTDINVAAFTQMKKWKMGHDVADVRSSHTEHVCANLLAEPVIRTTEKKTKTMQRKENIKKMCV